MTPPAQQLPGFRETDFGHYIRHYASLLWRWKPWVIISAPLAFCAAGAVVLKLAGSLPELPATALISMEPMSGMIGIVMAEQPDENTHAKLIKSRFFLNDVVTTMALRLRVFGHARSEIFDSVSIDTSAPCGSFAFTVDRDNKAKYSLFLKGRFFGREKISRGTLAELEALALPGIRLHFCAAFLRNPHDFSFAIVNSRSAVEGLYSSLEVSPLNSRMQRNPSFGIAVTGTDYQLIAATANTIADKYVEKNLNLRRARSAGALTILEKQLETAKKELSESERRLKDFRSANPTVGLDRNTGDMMSQMSETEVGSSQLGKSLYNARALQKKLITSGKEDRLDAARETIVFLTAQGRTSGPVLDAELTRLLVEQRDLIRAYDKNHPLIAQNQTTLNDAITKISAELDACIKAMEVQQSDRNAAMISLSAKMRSLPVKELELAQLMRQQQVNADIFSKILDKYNQSKVSDVVDMPDIYVMDYAVPPLPPPPELPKLFGISLLLILGVVFGPMVVADMTSKSVRTEQELRRIIPMTVLESIPKIVARRKSPPPAQVVWGKETPKEKKAGNPGDKLLTNEFKQEYIKELFRSLRTKILLGLQDVADKSLVVTSLEESTGKSTIASNIAIAIAKRGTSTLLIDGDLRMGMLHRFFNYQPTPGLSELLTSDIPLNDTTIAPFIRETPIAALSIIPCGRHVDISTELLTLARFSELKNLLAKKYKYIIFDSPPIGLAADAMSVIDAFSRYITVVKAGQTNVVDLKKKIQEYPLLSSKIMGMVLNFATIDGKLKYYKYSKYYSSSAVPL